MTFAGAVPRTRLFVIHNPNAGTAAQDLFRDTLVNLKRLGATVEIVTTARHGEGTKAAFEASESGRFDAIVSAGGDGTARDVAEGLLGSPYPLAVMPMGTGNVLSREIDIPQTARELALTLVRGTIHEIPVGQVNGRPFLFVIGVGFDAEAVRLFESGGTRDRGQLGFLPPVLRALRYEDTPLRVSTENGEQEARWLIVTRAKRYAANLLLAPEADLHSARFHLLCMSDSGPLNRVRQLAALALGVIERDPAVRTASATWIRVEGGQSVPVQIDGEVLERLPLEIGIHPKRLKLIFPARSDA